MRHIPFSSPDITDNDISAMNEVVRSGWLSHGKYTEKLEDLFRNYTEAKYAVAVSNCTAGLHLSCMAAGFSVGDEIIVPAQTHTATAHAVELTGAQAKFVDVDPIKGNIDIEELKSHLTKNTKGIIPVHMAGYPCEMDAINEICADHDLTLIEDCAHSLGTRFQNKHVGNFGISGNYSFYPTKQITTGEGGILTTNSEAVYRYVKTHKAFGIDTPPELRKRPGVYDVKGLGLNYRMTDFQAALGVGQMERYDANLASRQKNGKLYAELLKDVKGINYTEFTLDNSFFLFQIILDRGFNRDKLLLRLRDAGIGVSIHYATPVPLMSYYKNKYNYSKKDFPNACYYGDHCISLPVHGKLSEQEIRYIVKKIDEGIG